MNSYDPRSYTRQLLNAMGLERSIPTRRFGDTMSTSMWFGAGLLVGAGVALMLTPKTGRELRNDLSRQASQLGDRVRESMPALPGKATERNEWEENVAST